VDLTITATGTVVPVGGRTHWDIGGAPARDADEVRVPAGIVSYDPADLTVRVRAGTTVAELAAALADSRQECVLDPRSPDATVGGLLACGLSGLRRLRWGPVRDRVLEVRVLLANGRVVKGGGPTVKNVSGYDLPRLIVGSLGTLGVITEVVLRCQPQAVASAWAIGNGDPFAVRARTARPSSLLWDGTTTAALFEGHPGDIDEEIRRGELTGAGESPPLPFPDGPYRGRISVKPSSLRAVGAGLRELGGGVRWVAEIGAGTVHVAAADARELQSARTVAENAGGWMLREAGDVEPFGRDLPNIALLRRLRAAFDPAGRMNPGRLPL